MRPNWRSSGVATAEAMVSGLAPGQLGLHLNGREIHLRQGRHGQELIRDRARERQRHGQQRGANGPMDKQGGDIHTHLHGQRLSAR